MPPVIVWLDSETTNLNEAVHELVSLNFGTIIAPGSKTLAFRLGNKGDALAEDLTISVEAASGSFAYSWKYFSTDGVSFGTVPLSQTPVVLGGLGANTVTDPLYLKSQPPIISNSVPSGGHYSTLVCDYTYV